MARSPKVGRNDACPCGSGKKSKRCCDGASGRTGLQALEAWLVREVWDYARGVLDGWDPHRDYPGDADSPANSQILAPWALFHYESEGATALDCFAQDAGASLTERERGFIEAQRRAWFSCWEVLDAEPGVSIRARDLLTGVERLVSERSASRSVRRFEVLLCRVVEVDDVAIFGGMHPLPLDPIEARSFALALRDLCQLGDRPLTVEAMREGRVTEALIGLWDGWHARKQEQPIRLENTDGEALVPTEDHFALRDARERDEVRGLLVALEHAQEEELDDGTSCVVLHRLGNAMHPDWENTVLGRARLGAETLVLETNSSERADAVRRLVEAACGPRIAYVARGVKPLPSAAELARTPRGSTAAAPTPPEIGDLVREMKESHYRAWLDQPLPSLGGESPRAASKSETLRPALDLLLKELAMHESSAVPAERFDFVKLRAALGMEAP